MRLPAAFIDFVGDFVGLLYPRVCLACQEPLARGEADVCTNCWAQLPYTDCHLLPPTSNPLARRFWGKLPVTHTLGYLTFQKHGRVQHLLHQLKYKNQQQIGKVLGAYYGQELAKTGYTDTFELIVPVPLHPRKLALRGYNQADSFAEALAAALSCAWHPEALRRTTHTESQTRKNRLQRWQNVASVFEAARPDLITGQHILVVDDVLTTGATLEACCAVLLAAGAREVSVATIAVA